MQRFDLILRTRSSQALMVVVVACLMVNAAAAEQGTGEPKPGIPLIVMDQVPLIDAIKNLAVQAEFNYIVAPDVMAAPATNVSVRWENLTAMEALNRMLAEHRLVLVENPETTVTRIAGTNDTRKPAYGNWLTAGTNAAVPLIVMAWVPLDQAILALVRQAGLNAELDPRLSKSLAGNDASMPDVSIRWKNLTARQALAAVLDNYDLVLVPGGPNEAAQITARKWADAKSKAGGEN